MSLYRVAVEYEFCVDANSEQEALEVFSREHAMAISDGRCGLVGEPALSAVVSEAQLLDATLNEVPLNAFDFTARDRLERD